ncbi:contractile injection system protein, VgrG/Pvc8 family, partial [Achromobacter kerstersii]|uniref:contractile injection system protein, VgrG/Pvc8 family n=1 Tax=Achromobacter kerstersii TaxID=1353890 RepID=UPI000A8665EC
EPSLARAALCSDWRVFQQLSVPEILADVLKRHGITDYEQVTTNEHLPREYCVQAGEADLAFMNRLAAEEGYFHRYSRLLGLRRDARMAQVEGDDARLIPGVAFDLTGHPRDDWNQGWRPVRMRHHGVQHTSQEED